MKKKVALSLALSCLILGGCVELMTMIPSIATQTGGLTKSDITNGLKEALVVGAINSVSIASVSGGFSGNPLISIPFPQEAIIVKNTLEKAGLANLTANFEKSLNRAAEEATKKSLPILKDAITGMTITDALGILQGSDTAATMYLRTKTETNLRTEFVPIVNAAIATVNVTSYWNPIATSYNKLALVTGGPKVNPDLGSYVTQKTLDGLFLLISQEEAKIRNDPAARVTDLLKKVFSAGRQP